MKIKTYRARTMQEALRTIKAELGPDAVILSTRQIRRGQFLGLFGRYMIEVSAALDSRRVTRAAAAGHPAGPRCGPGEERIPPPLRRDAQRIGGAPGRGAGSEPDPGTGHDRQRTGAGKNPECGESAGTSSGPSDGGSSGTRRTVGRAMAQPVVTYEDGALIDSRFGASTRDVEFQYGICQFDTFVLCQQWINRFVNCGLRPTHFKVRLAGKASRGGGKFVEGGCIDQVDGKPECHTERDCDNGDT